MIDEARIEVIAHIKSPGDTTRAIAAYEQAIAINPKVGAKRRRSALQKRKS